MCSTRVSIVRRSQRLMRTQSGPAVIFSQCCAPSLMAACCVSNLPSVQYSAMNNMRVTSQVPRIKLRFMKQT
jgi:predicted aconitase with swiveling domain